MLLTLRFGLDLCVAEVILRRLKACDDIQGEVPPIGARN